MPGTPGRDGVDGVDGVSVTDANIDFDGSLVISLSSGQQINVGEVVSPDLADKIQVISTMSTNGAVGIKDEGSSISTGVKSINFVGATVTATNSGDDVTVNVSAGTGTVTSVAATVPAFLSVAGSPITTSGTLAISLSGTALPVANGGTGVTTSTGTTNVVLSNSPTLVTPALGTPSSGVVTNLTGTASININGTVGATTANTGAFTTLSASSGNYTSTGGFLLGADIGATTVTNATRKAGIIAVPHYTNSASKVMQSWVDSDSTANLIYYGGGLAGFNAATQHIFKVGATSTTGDGSVVATISSTGLAVTGTLSATGVATFSAGSAAAPAITTTGDTNTGIFFPAADTIAFAEGGAEAMRIDSSGNLGIGTSSPNSDTRAEFTKTENTAYTTSSGGNLITLRNNSTTAGVYAGIQFIAVGNGADVGTAQINAVQTASGSAALAFGTRNSATTAEKMRLDSSGNLLVGRTTQIGNNAIVNAERSAGSAYYGKVTTTNFPVINCWNAISSGDNIFASFAVDTGYVEKGTITYNRTAGLVAYNTTSDYRAKDISGPVTDSGALIDSTPVYMGKMKDATQERPMFIAHEVPAYAHTGDKDAVDADGKPVYQQMDASALIPVMWAELQSLRARVAQLESKP